MAGHVIISHGLDSGPEASKATALAEAAESLGWSHERPDYRDLDARGELGDVEGRIRRLLERAREAPRQPLVLAGSSMGAYVSGHASLQVPVAGLFLMAPPVALQASPPVLRAAAVPTRIVHGWEDELIPALAVVRWAETRRDLLVLVPDSHRLAGHVRFCAEEFARFLRSLPA
ncbi:hypothetical protein [Arenimonas fontis]|uniref:Alpha/beta hydrolase n=1 Tax=Arenimonas fontis TaxID=2608255 RepID=A0A5B2ZEV3_9GAMM|nr:hypothetical protein [Arenimonas fontis]KAA2285612.1 hypothetical protein F0415_02940 [Arenimonas fontis]